ncbi:MAG: hypothetical protein GOU97_01110 [Nanoarchaeota archaeon]|nr:hypothetical protein [Nanoarchaeota archaeon]
MRIAKTKKIPKKVFTAIILFFVLTSYYLLPLLLNSIPSLLSRIEKGEILNDPTSNVNCQEKSFLDAVSDMMSEELISQSYFQREFPIFLDFLKIFNSIVLVLSIFVSFILRKKNIIYPFILLITILFFCISLSDNFLPPAFGKISFIATRSIKYFIITPIIFSVFEPRTRKLGCTALIVITLIWGYAFFVSFGKTHIPVEEFIHFPYNKMVTKEVGPRTFPTEANQIIDYLKSKNVTRTSIYPFKGFFSRISNIYAGNVFSAYEEFFFPQNGVEILGATAPYADPKYEIYTLKTIYPFSCLHEIECLPERAKWPLINLTIPQGLGDDTCKFITGQKFYELLKAGDVKTFGVNAVFPEFIEYVAKYPRYFLLDKVINLDTELIFRQYYFYDLIDPPSFVQCNQNVTHTVERPNDKTIIINFKELAKDLECNVSTTYTHKWAAKNASIGKTDYGFIKINMEKTPITVKLKYEQNYALHIISFAGFLIMALYPLWRKK